MGSSTKSIAKAVSQSISQQALVNVGATPVGVEAALVGVEAVLVGVEAASQNVIKVLMQIGHADSKMRGFHCCTCVHCCT